MMDNEYTKTMKEFFSKVDKSTESDPRSLALAFANHFWHYESWTPERRHKVYGASLPTVDDIYTISILSQNTPLSFLTKRIPLVANTTVLTHYEAEHHIFFDNGDHTPTHGSDMHNISCYIRCPDIVELGHWLRDCKALLLQGDVFYFPNILREETREDYYSQDAKTKQHEESTPQIYSLIGKSKKLADILPDKVSVWDMVIGEKKVEGVFADKDLKLDLVYPILEIDLPYVTNTDLETFSKITADQKEALDRFRDFLRIKFLDLKRNEESEFFTTNLAKIGIELREGVRELDAEFDGIKKKRAFQVTGALVAATTATLVAINSTVFGHLPELLGTSGGILALSKVMEDYYLAKKKLQASPYYYLWLFSRKVKEH